MIRHDRVLFRIFRDFTFWWYPNLFVFSQMKCVYIDIAGPSSDSSYLPVFGSPILPVTLLNHSLNTTAFCLIFSSPNSGALSLTTVNSSHGPSSVKSEPMSPSQQQQQQSHLRPPSNSGMPGSPHSIHSHHSPVTSPVPPDYEHQSMSKRPRMDTSWNQV